MTEYHYVETVKQNDWLIENLFVEKQISLDVSEKNNNIILEALYTTLKQALSMQSRKKSSCW